MEGYETDISNISVGDDGYDICGGGDDDNASDSDSVLSVIDIPESRRWSRNVSMNILRVRGWILVIIVIGTINQGDEIGKGSEVSSWVHEVAGVVDQLLAL